MDLSWLMHAFCAQVERLPYCPTFIIETKNPNSTKLITCCSSGDHRREVVLKSSSNPKEELRIEEGDDIDYASGFQMPLHYPRYKKEDYETMEEWKLDMLLKEYGFMKMLKGTLDEKRRFAMGAFLWPDQL